MLYMSSFANYSGGSMWQCPYLRVHPSPSVYISMAECTIFGGLHPVCARFLSYLLLLYIGRVHGAIPGCTVLWEVHPASAQNKSLISDTNVGLRHVNIPVRQHYKEGIESHCYK